MKLRKFVAASVGTMLALSLSSAPLLATATEPGSEPVTDKEWEEGAQEISFESSQGTVITPGETITFTPDRRDDGVGIATAYMNNSDHFFNWDLAYDRDAATLTLTAPGTPEEQKEAGRTNIVDYGEHDVHIRTSNWNSYLLTVDFQPEEPEEPEQPEEPEDPSSIADLSDQLRSLSSNLSSSN